MQIKNVLKRDEIWARIVAGRFGEIFRADQVALQRERTIKVILRPCANNPNVMNHLESRRSLKITGSRACLANSVIGPHPCIA
jgi:hypothetical protein